MKLKIYPYLFIGSLSCTTGVNKLDAQSEGARTELENTQIENLNQEKRSIKDRLIAEILADGFVTDTNRMHIIEKYAYQDLRIGKFQQTKDLSFKYLRPENHSMAAHSLLEKGMGYYFVKKDSTGSTMNGVDFTVEFWIANTSDFARLREMEYAWLEDDYPMPSYFVLRSDTIVFFKTRSVQFAKSVEKYVNIANENEQHNTH